MDSITQDKAGIVGWQDLAPHLVHKLKSLNKPYAVFAEVIDPAAMEQFIEAMSHESIVKGAVMPDVHKGYSLPIGSVVAADGMIFPAFVGYDIGCGMCALRLDGVTRKDIEACRDQIFDEIYKTIPVGNTAFDKSNLDGNTALNPRDLSVIGKLAISSRDWSLQMGTLGGGNHFIEIGADGNDGVWIVIHSGSRGAGHSIATQYMKLASGSEKPLEGNHGFGVDTQVGQDYINDLAWGLQYALDNRSTMIRSVESVISAVTGSQTRGAWGDLINRNHNHATLREVDGRKVWIHRKGATHAEDGMDGVIPGNMRDGSFIVRGKGNPDSLFSSSHGAGRVLSRTQAKKTVSLNDFEKTMAESGVKARVSGATIDESPFAYKDVFDVMRLQAELVDVVAHIRPLINIKG